MANTIYWFRKALRLHDNPSLVQAIAGSGQVNPVFVLDPWFVRSGRVGTNRMQFLLQALEDVDESLRKMDSRLILLQGNPVEELPRVMKEWGVTRLAFELDTEPYALKRDEEVKEAARRMGVEVVTCVGHTLVDPAAVVERAGGKPVTVYGTFCNHLKEVMKKAPVKTVAEVKEMSGLCDGAKKEVEERGCKVPTLAEIGYDAGQAKTPFKGGEKEALKRMEKYLSRTKWIADFEKPNTSPAVFDPEERSTTVLSPYLKFGCLSARHFYLLLLDVYRKAGKHTQPPVSLEGQLLWREFYYVCSVATPNYERMEGNPICRQIPWGSDQKHEEFFLAWKEARTGYPWIDAAMTQLRDEGHIHHLARHAVACFLTRGDLWVHWEKGVEVFDELLIDADWALNVGNWMWLSASCFFYQFFRVYSPVAFPKKYDPEGKFVKKYLPVLKNMPAKFIYEPWKAPISVQKQIGVMIGKDYPAPIVEHEKVSKENMAKMKDAYDANKEAAGAVDNPKASGGKRKAEQETEKEAKKTKKDEDKAGKAKKGNKVEKTKDEDKGGKKLKQTKLK